MAPLLQQFVWSNICRKMFMVLIFLYTVLQVQKCRIDQHNNLHQGWRWLWFYFVFWLLKKLRTTFDEIFWKVGLCDNHWLIRFLVMIWVMMHIHLS